MTVSLRMARSSPSASTTRVQAPGSEGAVAEKANHPRPRLSASEAPSIFGAALLQADPSGSMRATWTTIWRPVGTIFGSGAKATAAGESSSSGTVVSLR